jgi:uncharacterized membrane protein YczE
VPAVLIRGQPTSGATDRVVGAPATHTTVQVASSIVPLVDLAVAGRPYQPRSSTTDWAQRLLRCVSGLTLFGIGISLILQAHLGAAPWDVFHQGVSELTGISIGNVIVIVGVLLLLLWIPLRQRPGVGTLLNALLIGIVVDIVLPLLPDTDRLVPRVVFLIAGTVAIAIGSGLYIGSGLGAGPRDGIMVGLRDRGVSVRWGRTAIEIVVLAVGMLLGGTVGVGTVVFTFSIGPLVHIFLPRLSLPRRVQRPRP